MALAQNDDFLGKQSWGMRILSKERCLPIGKDCAIVPIENIWDHGLSNLGTVKHGEAARKWMFGLLNVIDSPLDSLRSVFGPSALDHPLLMANGRKYWPLPYFISLRWNVEKKTWLVDFHHHHYQLWNSVPRLQRVQRPVLGLLPPNHKLKKPSCHWRTRSTLLHDIPKSRSLRRQRMQNHN